MLCGNGGNFKQQVSVPIYIQNRTHDASEEGVTHTEVPQDTARCMI